MNEADAVEREPSLAWSLSREQVGEIALQNAWKEPVSRDWAWGGSRGAGVRICIVDSGIDLGHPAVGGIDGAWVVRSGDDDEVVETDTEGDSSGHGTACAGIVRSLAPDCELYSVRVLGPKATGSGRALLAGLEWAIEQGFEVINMSLSTNRSKFAAFLHELADRAYFKRSLLVCSAHNTPVESFPWRFSSVVSVGSHEETDPLSFFYNPSPPVEFYARGLEVEIAWPGGGTVTATGNSFATPHLAAIAALILAKHPTLTPFQAKSVLHGTANNVGGE